MCYMCYTWETNAASIAVKVHPAAVIFVRIGWPFDRVITLEPSVTKSCSPVTTTTQQHSLAKAMAGPRAWSELWELSTPFWAPSKQDVITIITNFKPLFHEPSTPNISILVLQAVLYTIPMVLVKQLRAFLLVDHFLYSHNLTVWITAVL